MYSKYYQTNQAKYITPEAFKQMTEQQRISFDLLLQRWDVIKTPFHMAFRDNCLFGEVGYGEIGKGSMWIGIESDGYTHT